MSRPITVIWLYFQNLLLIYVIPSTILAFLFNLGYSILQVGNYLNDFTKYSISNTASIGIFVLVGFIIIFFSISCNRINEKMLMDVEVYYVLKDSFLGNRTKCRVLLKIPKENNKVFNTGESIILCMKNEFVKFTLFDKGF